MSNQDSAMESRDGGGMAKNVGKAANDAISKASGMAQQAADTAKQAASDTTTKVSHQVKDMLDRQVGSGADMVGHFATSAKRAAEELDKNAPYLAGFVHVFADRIEGYSDDLRDQTVDQLIRSGADFTRRQPALVFGLAALAGFFAFRTLKSAPPATPSPSIQPSHEHSPHTASQFHGS
jgi:uncharacterized protein YjbJ (UPF0337 family)